MIIAKTKSLAICLLLFFGSCDVYMDYEIETLLTDTNRVIGSHILDFLAVHKKKDSKEARELMASFTEDIIALKKRKNALHKEYPKFTVRNLEMLKRHQEGFLVFRNLFSQLLNLAAVYINARPDDKALQSVAGKAHTEFLDFFNEEGLPKMKSFFDGTKPRKKNNAPQ